MIGSASAEKSIIKEIPKLKVLYICYTGFTEFKSGSAVRPYRIYKAFLDKGYEVLLINGDMKTRRAKYLELKRSNALSSADFCYIEPSTYPVHPLDYLIFFHVKKEGIPTGLFYRDMYHKFPSLFNKKGLRKWSLLFRYKLDWMVFKRVSRVIFFPSNTMASYFDFHTKAALPPGSEAKFIDKEKLFHNVIYVGGISEEFGAKILLEAMKIVNERYRRIDLILICREENMDILNEYRDCEWLSVMNLSGEALNELYRRSDIAVIPRKRSEYNDFAVPVKLFEYLGYGMPVISTDCTETADFINKNRVGAICKDDPESMAEKIIELYDDPARLKDISNNIKYVISEENLWEHRIEKIEEYLIGSKRV